MADQNHSGAGGSIDALLTRAQIRACVDRAFEIALADPKYHSKLSRKVLTDELAALLTRRDADPAQEPGWQPLKRDVCSKYSRPAGVLGGPCLTCGASQPEHVRRPDMPEQIPTIGRIVHYRLSAQDAEQIMRRRTDGHSIAMRMKIEGSHPELRAWPAGAQAHIGNDVKEGDTFPMLVVKMWGDTPTSAVNGQVFLDGNDVLWATSVCVGEGPRTFSWPSRA